MNVALVLVVLAGCAHAAFPPYNYSDLVCWKDTVDRGVGVPISACPPDRPDLDAGLCYVACKANYTGVGPVCWGPCPTGWINEGALCREPGSIRTVARSSYGRGVGTPMVCAPSVPDYDAGLCYVPCPAEFVGVGPVCWLSCGAVALDPVDGGAICCHNTSLCDSKVVALTLGVPEAVLEAILSGGNVTALIDSVKDAVDAVLGFVMPLCSQVPLSDPPERAVARNSFSPSRDDPAMA